MTPAEVAAHQLERLHSATIDVVAKYGYADAKVRDISAVSGVSTRAFYEHFDSKQDCVLQTYELVMRRATRRIIATQAQQGDWRERAQLVLAAFANELKAAPSAGRFALVETRAGGQAARERVRRAERNFESLLAECLARAPGGMVLPPLLIEAVVAGVIRVSCPRLVSNRAAEISKLTPDLAEWALCYASEDASALEELDRRAGAAADSTQSLLNSSKDISLADSDRNLILTAIAKLAVTDGYTNLTIPRIRRAAGVSRKAYDEHFGGIDDCFIAALNQRGEEILSRASLAQVSSHTWSGGLYQAMVTFCDGIATDPFLASVCLEGNFNPGSRVTQARSRMIGAVTEQLTDSIPAKHRPGKPIRDAMQSAIWGLFQNHLVKERATHALPSATLAYLALAPAIGPSAALAAIRREQKE